MKSTMKYFTIFIAAMSVTAAQAKTDVTGMWFTCLPKELGEQSNPFELLRIKYVHKQIIWTSEWGVGFSAHGRGFRQNNGLELHGCHYLHGKVLRTCNIKNPPIHLRLKEQFFTAPANKAALADAILDSQPILTSANKWDALALACEALVLPSATAVAKTPPTTFRVNTAFPAFR
jgi:hypothetical protein